ncbi:hypothetical protein RD1_4137 [Roseobacter denitrificans OCh 114]|uniref:Uncharacterized protein n=1 Tax=Roseobacter denitrificans (strain ATCC 33942 / OCh 114) TaxID=375451 RepID=Q160L6_ROSDO|nr:hypothetical protein RD1_4137 [Roseobacter denitrificans OCh 114]
MRQTVRFVGAKAHDTAGDLRHAPTQSGRACGYGWHKGT